MKHILPALLFLALSFSSFVSQSQIVFSPNDKEVNGFSDDFDVAIYSSFVNLSEYDSFRWVRISNTLAAGWESAVCDNVQCHAATVDSSDFLLAKNDSFNFSFHFYPYDKAGQGSMQVYVYALLNPAVNTSGTYRTTIWKLSVPGIPEVRSLFPNPVTNILYSKDLNPDAKVKIVQINGALSAEFSGKEVSGGADLSALPAGIYLAEIEDNGTLRREKLIIRR